MLTLAMRGGVSIPLMGLQTCTGSGDVGHYWEKGMFPRARPALPRASHPGVHTLIPPPMNLPGPPTREESWGGCSQQDRAQRPAQDNPPPYYLFS